MWEIAFELYFKEYSLSHMYDARARTTQANQREHSLSIHTRFFYSVFLINVFFIHFYILLGFPWKILWLLLTPNINYEMVFIKLSYGLVFHSIVSYCLQSDLTKNLL